MDIMTFSSSFADRQDHEQLCCSAVHAVQDVAWLLRLIESDVAQASKVISILP